MLRGFRWASGGKNFFPKVLPDEPPSPFREGHFIGETAFEKNPNGRMVKYVGGCDQGNVLADSQVHQAAGFRQNEHLAYDWRLDLVQFLTKVFNKKIVEPLIAGDRLLANEAEALIQPAQDLR
jgi:hypothetical protein